MCNICKECIGKKVYCDLRTVLIFLQVMCFDICQTALCYFARKYKNICQGPDLYSTLGIGVLSASEIRALVAFARF